MLLVVQRWGIRLLLLFTVLVGLSLATTTPPPHPAVDDQINPGFDTCPLPCWAGITPAETRTDAVPRLITAHLPGMNVEFRGVVTQINFAATTPGQTLRGVVYDKRGLVSGIRLETHLPLWQVMELLGAPDCIRISQGTDGHELVAVSWQTEHHVISGTVLLPSPDVWQPSATISLLGIFEGYPACAAPGDYRWHGFAPIWQYR